METAKPSHAFEIDLLVNSISVYTHLHIHIHNILYMYSSILFTGRFICFAVQLWWNHWPFDVVCMYRAMPGLFFVYYNSFQNINILYIRKVCENTCLIHCSLCQVHPVLCEPAVVLYRLFPGVQVRWPPQPHTLLVGPHCF